MINNYAICMSVEPLLKYRCPLSQYRYMLLLASIHSEPPCMYIDLSMPEPLSVIGFDAVSSPVIDVVPFTVNVLFVVVLPIVRFPVSTPPANGK